MYLSMHKIYPWMFGLCLSAGSVVYGLRHIRIPVTITHSLFGLSEIVTRIFSPVCLASPILVGIWADLPEVCYLMSPYMAHILPYECESIHIYSWYGGTITFKD